MDPYPNMKRTFSDLSVEMAFAKRACITNHPKRQASDNFNGISNKYGSILLLPYCYLSTPVRKKQKTCEVAVQRQLKQIELGLCCAAALQDDTQAVEVALAAVIYLQPRIGLLVQRFRMIDSLPPTVVTGKIRTVFSTIINTRC